MIPDDLPSAAQIGEACVCLNAQRTARAVARRYDAAFQSIGLTSGQFSILAALHRDQPVALSDLARSLGVERTTLTRNLVPLEARKWIASEGDAQDRRIRRVALTVAGRAMLTSAIPRWQQAQTDSLKALAEAWPGVSGALARLREA